MTTTSSQPSTALSAFGSRSDATECTALANQRNSTALPWDDEQDFELVNRGFIGTISDEVIRAENGTPVMDISSAGRFTEEAPDTAHPSLWRLARLNSVHGLFKVADRLYQVRNLDISNMSVIVGDRGYILVDPLYSDEPVRAALELVYEHLGRRPVTGLIYTHAHLDHFGGSRAAWEARDTEGPEVPIVAPEGFMEHAANENLHAGVAEARRNQYMFGALLPTDERGQITSSLGIGISRGRSSLIAPTVSVGVEGLETEIDGVQFQFISASGAESPAEMHFSLPALGAMCLAENLTRVMHNIYTLRGAQVRDALLWSKLIDQTIDQISSDIDVVFMGHHWPVWGRENILEYLERQRDLYRFMHDETLRLINHGYSGHEIAEVLTLPDGLSQYWPNRGLYGSLSHNVKAIYQRYMGWFDANPANLDPHPPSTVGPRYVQAMGGPQSVLALANEAFASGDYRWCSELLRHLLAVDPMDEDARHLQAASFEQMGYQAESGPWRNFYLSGAQELRGDEPRTRSAGQRGQELQRALSLDTLLDYLAIRFNGTHEPTLNAVIELNLDRDAERGTERRYLAVSNGTVHPAAVLRSHLAVTARLNMPIDLAFDLITGVTSWQDARPTVRITGDSDAIERFWAAMDAFSGRHPLSLARAAFTANRATD